MCLVTPCTLSVSLSLFCPLQSHLWMRSTSASTGHRPSSNLHMTNLHWRKVSHTLSFPVHTSSLLVHPHFFLLIIHTMRFSSSLTNDAVLSPSWLVYAGFSISEGYTQHPTLTSVQQLQDSSTLESQALTSTYTQSLLNVHTTEVHTHKDLWTSH